MGRLDTLQRSLLLVGMALATFLLVRFAMDFSAGMRAWLAAPFWALVLAALSVGWSNIFVKPAGQQSGNSIARGLLLAAIPAGFLASSLDCMGLSLQGCTGYCSFIKLVWIPLVALGCMALYYAQRAWLLVTITAMAFVTLLPHCLCYNVGNGWWIDRIGASPVCYAWGFAVTMIVAGALRSGARQWVSLTVCGAVIGGALVFFISHHYFHFPW